MGFLSDELSLPARLPLRSSYTEAGSAVGRNVFFLFRKLGKQSFLLRLRCVGLSSLCIQVFQSLCSLAQRIFGSQQLDGERKGSLFTRFLSLNFVSNCPQKLLCFKHFVLTLLSKFCCYAKTHLGANLKLSDDGLRKI